MRISDWSSDVCSSDLVATRQGNSLLVADYADNLRRIRGLIAQIDRDRAGIDTVTLRNSSAREIAATVNSLFGTGGGEGGNAALSILPVESSNSIVVRGDPALIQRVVQMVLELDRRAERTGDRPEERRGGKEGVDT